MESKSHGVINSFAWKVSERIAVQGIGLVVQIVLARLLMPEDFACLSIMNALINYLGMFVQAGLNIAVVQKKDLDNKDLSTLLSSSLFIALLIYVSLYFIAPQLSDFYNLQDLTWPIRVLSLSLFLYSFNTIQSGILARKMMFRTIFLRNVISLPIAALVGIILAYLDLGVWALVVYSLLNIFLTVLFMNLIPDCRIGLNWSFSKFKQLYSFSGKILISCLISNGSDTIRTLLVGKRFMPSDLAYYDRGYSYANLVTQTISQSIGTVMLPVLSREQDNDDTLLQLARRSIRIVAFLMIPALTIVAILAEPLVLLILSEKWMPCAIFLSLFCIFRMFGAFTTIDKQVFFAKGRSEIGLFYEIGLFIANISVLLLMVNYDTIHVALGAICVECVGNLILMYISSKVYSYSIKARFKDLVGPIVYSIVMAIPLLIIKEWDFLSPIILIITDGILGLAIYVFISIIFKDPSLLMIASRLRKMRHNYLGN